MKKRNPLINEPHLETLRARNVPVIFRNISTISNGALFLNTFLHSKIEEGVTVNVKLSDQSNLSVKDIKIKGNGTFAVSWCIQWFENIQTRTSWECLIGCLHSHANGSLGQIAETRIERNYTVVRIYWWKFGKLIGIKKNTIALSTA